MRLTLQRRQADLKRLQMAMETLSAINRPNRFIGVAMAFCNEMASQWHCERAGIGFLKGRYVQLKAMSHTEKFNRKMRIVQDIESVMEECLDQDIEIIYPADQEAAYIDRAAGELSKRYGPLAILSLPLRQDGAARAVLTLHRPADRPFNPEEIETARLTCELCTARLVSLYDSDRWIGAKAAQQIHRAVAGLLKPKYTWTKVAAMAIFVALIFVIFAKGQFRAEAPCVLEATCQQLVPAPFDGYIKSVSVLEGDMVEAGKTTLAKLDAAELMLQLAEAKAEKLGWDKQADAARGKLNTADVQIAEANADRIKAKIDLLEYQIRQANITSPIGGIVVKGDLKRAIGAPVKTGDVLFEIAALESLRAQLLVPEDQIANIREGQGGYLATVSFPGQRIRFVVERVNPMAEVVNGRNVFKVRVHLLTTYPWMRPGMEGMAKVSIGRRSYVWIWTRRLANWVRMKFWL
jgi:biotin carboxyl carrier protein